MSDAAPSRSDDAWLVRNVIAPAANGAVIEPINAGINTLNVVFDKLPTGSLPKLTEMQRCQPQSMDEVAAQMASQSLATLVPLVCSGAIAGGAMRATGRAVKAEGIAANVLASQRVANVVGPTAYELARDPHAGESRIGNALGTASAFSVFEFANPRLHGLDWKIKYPSYAGVGASAGLTQYLIANKITGNDITPEGALTAASGGAIFNVALPGAQALAGRAANVFDTTFNRGIPIGRFAEQHGWNDVTFTELQSKKPLTRVDDGPGTADHARQTITTGGDQAIATHELAHLDIATKPETVESMRTVSQLLTEGNEQEAWQVYRKLRAEMEQQAREVEAKVRGEQPTAMSVDEIALQQTPLSKTYEQIWQEDFRQWRETRERPIQTDANPGGSIEQATRRFLDPFSSEQDVQNFAAALRQLPDETARNQYLQASSQAIMKQLEANGTPYSREIGLRKLLRLKEIQGAGADDIDVINYRMNLAETLAKREHYSEAQTEFTQASAQLLTRMRKNAGWATPEEAITMLNTLDRFVSVRRDLFAKDHPFTVMTNDIIDGICTAIEPTLVNEIRAGRLNPTETQSKMTHVAERIGVRESENEPENPVKYIRTATDDLPVRLSGAWYQSVRSGARLHGSLKLHITATEQTEKKAILDAVLPILDRAVADDRATGWKYMNVTSETGQGAKALTIFPKPEHARQLAAELDQALMSRGLQMPSETQTGNVADMTRVGRSNRVSLEREKFEVGSTEQGYKGAIFDPQIARGLIEKYNRYGFVNGRLSRAALDKIAEDYGITNGSIEYSKSGRLMLQTWGINGVSGSESGYVPEAERQVLYRIYRDQGVDPVANFFELWNVTAPHR